MYQKIITTKLHKEISKKPEGHNETSEHQKNITIKCKLTFIRNNMVQHMRRALYLTQSSGCVRRMQKPQIEQTLGHPDLL